MKIKIPFWIEKQLNKILKPMLVTEVKIYVDDKLERNFYGKSLTANFLQFIYACFNDFTTSANWGASGAPFASNHDVIVTTGTLTSLTNTSYPNMNANIADVSRGFLIGTGTTAPTSQDYKLQSSIAHGTAVGQLQYQQMMSINGVTISGLISSLTVSRSFSNASGATINVSEMCMKGNKGLGYIIYRDTFTPLPVADGKTLKIDILFSVTT